MTQRISRSNFSVAVVLVAGPWLTSLASAQQVPPPPPVAELLVQAPAPEPTLAGPELPAAEAPVPTPAPEVAPVAGPELAPLAEVAPVPVLDPAAPTPVAAAVPDDLPSADSNMAVPDADVEAFARGPVHEAFADVYDLNPAANEIIATAPPAAVDELPPEQAPTGDNVQWIAGYWSWDAEAKDHLWVSGVWRDIPPGRRWVPGYWAEATGGFQWVGGFWADAQATELAYVPPPPESLEAGPNVPPPAGDQQWVPGNWSYVSDNYRWSPGYYTPCQQDFMYVPNQYSYTPNGCVFVPGYWDYRFAQRGTLFSPVRFRRPLLGYGFGRPAFYRPRYSVNMASFLIHLFVRPRNRNFYYGDYYGNQYANLGYTPWYRRSFVNQRIHDPALSFYRRDSQRRGIDFDRSVGNWHQQYESNVGLRPPRLISGQNQFLTQHPGNRAAQLAVMGNRFDDVARAHHLGSAAAFRQTGQNDLAVLRESRQVNHQLVVARRQTELSQHHLRAGNQSLNQGIDIRPQAGRNHVAGVGQAATPHRLSLGDMPTHLRDQTRASVAQAERLHANHHTVGRPALGNTVGNGPARVEAVRQQIDDRRALHQANLPGHRVAPTPSSVIHHQARGVDRNVQNSGMRINPGPVARQHHVVRQQDNPAPVIRHQAVMNNPVQRHVQRQAPIQQHIPVQRHFQAQQRAPAQHHMPVQRQQHAPAQHHAPHHRR